MSTERRQHQRLARPFDGNWEGGSGGTPCRIGDLSLGGCFVETLATPTAGEQTKVTINFGGDISMTFAGTVIYVEPRLGFAVKFHELDPQTTEQIGQMLEALASKR